MKKTNISALLLALITAIYVFVSLIGGLLTNASVAFWIGFGFFTFNTLVACTVLLVFGNSKTTIKDVFLNAPIYYVGAAYFAVSGVVSVLNMLLPLLSLKWLVIVHILLSKSMRSVTYHNRRNSQTLNRYRMPETRSLT